MEIFLIRHADTKGNLERRYVGRTDEPLCPEGVKKAEERGVFPEVTRVAVSPMKRARQTAAILFPNAEQIVYAGLAEMDFGAFDGKTYAEMADDADYRAWVDSGCEGKCPSGESRAEFVSRTAAAFKKAVADAQARGDTRLVLVAHGGTAMAVTSSFSDPPLSYFDCSIPHCGAYRYTLAGGLCGEITLTDCVKLKELVL